MLRFKSRLTKAEIKVAKIIEKTLQQYNKSKKIQKTKQKH